MRRCLHIISYNLKAQVIESGLVQKVNTLKKQIYNAAKREDFYMAETYEYERIFLENDDPVLYHEAEKVLAADRARATRLKKRIRNYLNMGHTIFLTLTFRDDVLQCTTPATRKQYVVRFLKSFSEKYVANIDYGSLNEREHYHAIVVTDRVDLTRWKYGFPYAEYIVETSDPLRLAHYINKLVNHAIKETTRRCHVIYSR